MPSVHTRISPWTRAGGGGEAAATARLGWNKVIGRAVFMSPCVVLVWTGEGKQPRVGVFVTFFLLYVYLRLLKSKSLEDDVFPTGWQVLEVCA